jgi:CBS domain-containing protein
MATPVKENDGLLVSNGYLAVKPLKQGKGWHELREALSTVRRLHRALQRQLRFMEGRRS